MKNYKYILLSSIILILSACPVLQAEEEPNQAVANQPLLFEEQSENIEEDIVVEEESSQNQEEPQAVEQQEQPSQLDISDFRILTEKNIFSRTREPKRESQGSRPGPRPTPRVILSMFILRGIAIKGEEKTAFIEEEVAGQFTRATVGTSVAEGVIKDIKPDRVIFEQNGQEREVLIGGELNQIRSDSSTETGTETETEVQPETVEPAKTDTSTGADKDEILRIMLERRKQQIGD